MPRRWRSSPQLEGFRAKGVEVLLLSDQSTPSGRSGWTASRASRSAASPRAASTSRSSRARRPAGEAGRRRRLLALLKAALEDGGLRGPRHRPAGGQRRGAGRRRSGPDLQMQRLLRRAGREPAAGLPVLEINPRHPLIRKLAGSGPDGTTLAEPPGCCSTSPACRTATCRATRRLRPAGRGGAGTGVRKRPGEKVFSPGPPHLFTLEWRLAARRLPRTHKKEGRGSGREYFPSPTLPQPIEHQPTDLGTRHLPRRPARQRLRRMPMRGPFRRVRQRAGRGPRATRRQIARSPSSARIASSNAARLGWRASSSRTGRARGRPGDQRGPAGPRRAAGAKRAREAAPPSRLPGAVHHHRRQRLDRPHRRVPASARRVSASISARSCRASPSR